jgi:hypothetical protein
MAISQQMKANNANFNGDLMSAAVDNQLRPLTLPEGFKDARPPLVLDPRAPRRRAVACRLW